MPGAVQTVQGGIDPGETPEQAARRELTEEVGLVDGQYELIGSLSEPLRYLWPPEVKAKLKKPRDLEYDGQEQYFFLARIPAETVLVLDAHEREFSRADWGDPQALVDGAWEYKKPVLKAALEQFGLL